MRLAHTWPTQYVDLAVDGTREGVATFKDGFGQLLCSTDNHAWVQGLGALDGLGTGF